MMRHESNNGRIHDMTQAPSAQNLTGIWHGLYSYPYGRPPVSFVATLIEFGSTVNGTTHEPCDREDGSCETLFATLLGRRRGSMVAFLKTYDGANPNYSRVIYEGTLSVDGTEIEGRWLLPGSSGKFLMVRSAGGEEAVTRQAFEQA
jgi:hypothetical protein